MSVELGPLLEPLSRRRRWTNNVAITILGLTVALATAALLAVLGFTIAKGAGMISIEFLTKSMKGVGPLDHTGGLYHAIIGTLEQVVIAALISIPLGLLTAVYIVEYSTGRLVAPVRFFVDVMTGIPSIVAGLFVFAFWVLGLHRGFSGFAAGMALSVLMLPVVTRASEEMLRLVPDHLREASLALGTPRWRTIVSVVLPTASSGLTTAVVLAIARVTGETAPLLVTAFGFDAINANPWKGAQGALPLYVYREASSAFDFNVQRAWGAALTLVFVVVVLIVIARVITRQSELSVT